MNLKETDYYVGLDCGTSSIGFAVTDTDYNLLQARHKDMWGSHLFDEASTAPTTSSAPSIPSKAHCGSLHS